ARSACGAVSEGTMRATLVAGVAVPQLRNLARVVSFCVRRNSGGQDPAAADVAGGVPAPVARSRSPARRRVLGRSGAAGPRWLEGSSAVPIPGGGGRGLLTRFGSNGSM